MKERKNLFEQGCLAIIGGATGYALLGATPLSLGIISAGAGMCIYNFIEKSDRYKKLFESCGLVNNVYQFPKLKKKKETKYGEQLIFTLPSGLSTNDIEKNKLRIEQFLNKKIKIDYANNNLLINIYDKTLNTEYKFESIKTGKILDLIIGYSIGDKLENINLESAPHLLIGGQTGSGKSTLLRSVITNLIIKNTKNIELHLIDLKNGAEFNIFRKCKIVKSFNRNKEEAENTLKNLIKEVDRRYDLFFEKECVDIKQYNEEFKKDKLDYKIIIIDEFADLQDEKNSISLIDELARKARACGIHMILSTQRPSANVLNGDIKANIPTIIGLKTMNSLNSRIIIDKDGLEELRGKGNGIIINEGKEVEFQAMNLKPRSAMSILKPFYKSDKHEQQTKPMASFTKKTIDKNGEVDNFDFLERL